MAQRAFVVNSSTVIIISGSFPVSQFSASGGQSIGVSASASVLPMNIYVTGKDRASCQSGGAPALCPGAVAQSPGREAFYALEKAMATHSSILAWRIPGTGPLASQRHPGKFPKV